MKIKTLSNGVRVAVVPVQGMRAVTVEIQVKIGAKYENKTEAGLSHFLEHMAFKGTEKRPNATVIFREMDTRGASFEAETGYESTSYGITTTAGNREWTLEILSDILFNSKFPEDEIIKERGVISQEIKMYQDNPMMGLSSEAVKWLWQGSNLGCWDISGEIDDVKDTKREDLLNYHRKMFKTEETVVVMAGNVADGDITMAEKYFGKKRVGNNKLPELKIEWTEGKVKTIKKAVEQGHFGVLVPTFGSLDRRRYALRLLNVILAGNTSSRLFEEIRSKRGWAYYVYPIGENVVEDGFWGVQAGVPTEKLEEATEVVEKEIEGIGNNLETEEIERAKAYLNGKVELWMDKSDFWSGFIGNKILLENRVTSPEEELKKIAEVREEEIRELAKQIFKRDKIKSLVISK